MNTANDPTIILVHGAWADGSSWSPVIARLIERGRKVIAAPIPLTSLSDDIAALDRVLGRVDGPTVLVGHAYAGAVIAGSANAAVEALVFVAALAPDEGEAVADVFYRQPPHPAAPQLAPDPDGLIWMPDAAFASAFAHNATPERAALFAAVQRPIALACIQQPAPAPAWRRVPSWFLVAQDDRMIDASTQLFMAERMGATIVTAAVDHTPLATAPECVLEVIESAIAG